jgi:hypothetical protein
VPTYVWVAFPPAERHLANQLGSIDEILIGHTTARIGVHSGTSSAPGSRSKRLQPCSGLDINLVPLSAATRADLAASHIRRSTSPGWPSPSARQEAATRDRQELADSGHSDRSEAETAHTDMR